MLNINIPDHVRDELDRLNRGITLLAAEIRNNQHTYDKDYILELIENLKALQKRYRILRSEYDVFYFAYEYFSDWRNPDNENNLIPEGSTYENAPHFHYEICSKLDELNFNITKRIGWSVPRGHAKSAYLSNIFPVHQIVFNKRRYIIIISETESMARRFVEWVGNQLKFNKRLQEDYGVLLSENKRHNNTDNLDEFVTFNNVKVQSASIGKQLRGSRFLSYRPDLVILDDLESSKNTNTKELREKNLHWFNSVIMPIGDVTRTAFIYMGTLVHGQGLLPSVLKRSDFDSRIYSAIVSEPTNIAKWNYIEELLRDIDDDDREIKALSYYEDHREEMDEGVLTLWPGRFNYFDLLKTKINVGSRAFASEYLNRPSDDDSIIFKRDYFIFYSPSELEDALKSMDVFSFWDIAIGKNTKSDYNAIVTIGRNRVTGAIYVLDAWADKIPMHKVLDVAVQKIRRFKPKIFGVETVQAQYDMYRQLKEILYKEGIYHTRLLPHNPRARKEDRIETLEPLVESGFLRFEKGQRLLLEQLELYPGHDNDDLPDALASAVEIAGRHKKKSYYRKPPGF